MSENVYYQLMSGDTSRDFSGVMLDFGVALVGPGRYGPARENQAKYEELGEWGKIKWLLDIKVGDRIVLHSGQSLIQSVGEVVNADNKIYHYSSFFSDID